MNSKVAHPCGPRSLFSRAGSAVGAPRVRTGRPQDIDDHRDSAS